MDLTPDLCDQFGESLQVLTPGLRSFGGVAISALKLSLLRPLRIIRWFVNGWQNLVMGRC